MSVLQRLFELARARPDLRGLDEEVVEHEIVQHHHSPWRAQPIEEPEMVGVVADVDQIDLVGARIGPRRHQLDGVAQRPLSRSRPFRGCHDSNLRALRQGRQQLDGVVAHAGPDGRQRRGPKDSHGQTVAVRG